MARIDCYFGTPSPFAYLAGTRLEEIAARHGAEVAYHPLDVAALFGRTGGVPPGDRHENRQTYRLQELRRQAAKRGMPINLRPRHFPVNPAPSSYAVIAAMGEGRSVGPLAHAFGRAVWAEERDIADDATVREVLEAEGFDAGIADRGLLTGAEVYARNLERAVEAGAFGAPFYVVGDERFWGQDRLEDLDAHLSGRL